MKLTLLILSTLFTLSSFAALDIESRVVSGLATDNSVTQASKPCAEDLVKSSAVENLDEEVVGNVILKLEQENNLNDIKDSVDEELYSLYFEVLKKSGFEVVELYKFLFSEYKDDHAFQRDVLKGMLFNKVTKDLLENEKGSNLENYITMEAFSSF